MEDAEEAGSITANVVGVLGQSFDCPRRGLEQGGISDPLMAADEGPEWFGDGEGEHEMMPGQLPLYLFFEPLLGFVVLAAGTVAVTIRAVHDMKLMALFTVVEGSAIGFGAAVDKSVDDLFVLDGHGLPVVLDILRAVGTEEIIDDSHVISPP
jgi:hypothetical protein